MEYCLFVEPHQGGTFRQIADAARWAELWGFHGFFSSDHILPDGPRTAEGTTEAWTTLAGLALVTETIRLGTLVSSATFRHPSLLAIQASNVDDMSGGRIELGLGTGWFELEHRTFGIPFPRARFDILEAQLEVIDLLLRTPRAQVISTSGSIYPLAEAPGLANPSRDCVPLIVGGIGPHRTPALAARYAREFNIFRGPRHTSDYIDRVRAAAEAIGRDPTTIRFSAAIPVLTGSNDVEVNRRAARVGVNPRSCDGNMAIGGVNAVVDRIAEYLGTGVERVYLQVADLTDTEHLEQVGTEVLPLLPR